MPYFRTNKRWLLDTAHCYINEKCALFVEALVVDFF